MFQNIEVHAPQKAYNAEGLRVGDVVVGVVPNSISPCGQVDGFNRFFVPLEYGYLLSRYNKGFAPIGHPHLTGFDKVESILTIAPKGFSFSSGASNVGHHRGQVHSNYLFPRSYLEYLADDILSPITYWRYTGDGYEVFERFGVYTLDTDLEAHLKKIRRSDLSLSLLVLGTRVASLLASPFILIGAIFSYSRLHKLIPVLLFMFLALGSILGIIMLGAKPFGIDLGIGYNNFGLDGGVFLVSVGVFILVSLFKSVIFNKDFYMSLVDYWNFWVLGEMTPFGESLRGLYEDSVRQRPLGIGTSGLDFMGSSPFESFVGFSGGSKEVASEVVSEDEVVSKSGKHVNEIAFKMSTILDNGMVGSFEFVVPEGCSLKQLDGVLTTRVLGVWEDGFRDALTWLNRNFSQLTETSQSFVSWLESNTGLDEVYIMKRLALIEAQLGIDGIFSKHMRLESKLDD